MISVIASNRAIISAGNEALFFFSFILLYKVLSILKMFQQDYVSTSVMEDRSNKMLARQYGRLHEIADKFLNDKKFVRVAPESIVYLTTKPRRCYNLANSLTQAGYNVVVKPICANVGYDILCDFAPVFSFWRVPEEIFISITPKTSRILTLRNQLIFIYRDLADPTKFADFEENFKLRGIVSKNLEEKMNARIASGSREFRSVKSTVPAINFADEVYIGRRALEVYARAYGEDIAPGIVGGAGPAWEIISADVSATIEIIREEYGKKSIEVETQPFPVFSDIALTRTRITIGGEDAFYIYNSASYELVPFFVVDDKRIASVFVCARFVLINIFLIKFLLSHGKISKEDAEIKQTLLEIQHFILSTMEDFLLPKETTVQSLSQHYYGEFVEPRILFNDLCENERMYSPFETKIQHGKMIYF